MGGQEFEIARKLMQERWSNAEPAGQPGKATDPAAFREIDGRELARQYVAHRRLMEAESRGGLTVPGHEGGSGRAMPTPEQSGPSGPARLQRRLVGWLLSLWRN